MSTGHAALRRHAWWDRAGLGLKARPGGAPQRQQLRVQGPVEQHSFRVSLDNLRLQRHRRVWVTLGQPATTAIGPRAWWSTA